jgi:CHAT domain-containing protein
MLRFVLNREALPLNSLFSVANPTKDLFFTDAEVRGIAGHFTQPDILWYENAAKDTVLKNAGSASAVHFSCHGSFQFANPLDSMLILAGGKSDDAKNLSLKDIFANLKLSQGATVTLSACETGMVKLEQGDEYVGLPSGFLHSGASSVISSLWAVDDLSNVLLMGRLYDNIVAKQMGKAAAIREAQHYVRELTMKDIRELADNSEEVLYSFEVGRFKDEADDKKPYAHPYHWGAFVCSGNWA